MGLQRRKRSSQQKVSGSGLKAAEEEVGQRKWLVLKALPAPEEGIIKYIGRLQVKGLCLDYLAWRGT